METKLKNFGKVTLGKMLTTEDRGDFHLRPYLRSSNVQTESVDVSDVKEMWFTEKEMSELRLLKGDLLFNEGGDVGRTSIWNDEIPECYIQNSVNRVRVKGVSRYILYVSGLHHKTGYYDSQVNRVSIPHLTKEKLENVVFPVPPVDEQERIVEYLDRKTALIDSLIEKTGRKIELLKEKRTSLINEVVTKGLDPDVEMKDSGVEWIGEIPRHWGITKLKRHGSVIIGLSYKPENILDDESGTLVMRSSNVQNGLATFDDNVFVDCEIPEKLRTRKGDILICSRNGSRKLIGKNCLIDSQSEGNTWGVFMSVFRSTDPNFFKWILNSPVFESQSGLFLTSTINQLTVSTLENLVVPFVYDMEERREIVEYLDKQTAIIDSTITKEEKRIELLKEYRQSLISEVVTGKVKVS